jgi:uncharacterized membrane protein
MKNLNVFIKRALLGGAIVVLPVAIYMIVVDWLIGFITGQIDFMADPLAERLDQLYEFTISPTFYSVAANLMVLASIILMCFIVGSLVETRPGARGYRTLENRTLKKVPGYYLIKQTVVQFLGSENRPFSSVALVQVFSNDTLMTAFITDTHSDGSFTVFVPTGPNPMSGNIYHLRREYVHILDVPVEDAMRSIISCGAGSTKLLTAYHAQIVEQH